MTKTRRTMHDELIGVTTKVAGLLWSMGPAWYVLCEAIAASAFRGYSYANFYISDLGVPGFGELDDRILASELPQVMNAGFIGTGALFLLGLIVLLPNLGPGASKGLLAGFGILHVVGIVFVGLVPGSPHNVGNGLIIVHVLGAVAAIMGGNLAAITSNRALRGIGLSRSARGVGVALGALGLLSATLLSLHLVLPDGVWERGAVYPFMMWQLLTGAALLRTGRSSAERSRPMPENAPVDGRGG